MTNGSDPIALFTLSAKAWPEREALRVAGCSFSYAEMDSWSNSIARSIIDAGARSERIAFIADREASSYATILGILKAGCSYVPLHPDGPPARWNSMIERCGARFAMEHGSIKLPVERSVALPPIDVVVEPILIDVHGDQEAYVLFTSGSTGGPKGVSVLRGNVAAYLSHMLSVHDFHERDRFTQFFALTFDLSVHDLFVCWGSGACLCVPPDDGALRAAQFVRDERITVWFSVPAHSLMMWRMRSLAPNALPSLRCAFFCGEALPWTSARAFADAAPTSMIINLYGPTETTIAVTSFEVDRSHTQVGGLVPIGHVFPGHSGIEVDGELCLSGPQVSSGYVNDPLATSNAFFKLPGSDARWYRTGDRVRIDAEGIIHFLGRIDDQVKVLGHRVEPGEVDEVVSRALEGAIAVTVPMIDGSTTRLVTFIDMPSDVDALLEQCRALLPPHMVPMRIVVLKEMPRTAHGKTDRARLVELATNGQTSAS